MNWLYILLYLDLALIPVAWAINRRVIHREQAVMNVQILKLAKEHPEQWRKNAD